MSQRGPNRRALAVGAAALCASAGFAQADDAKMLTLYKSPSCGCCRSWAEKMKTAGFRLAVVDREDLTPIKTKLGVPSALRSCHTATIGGFVFEGHVPAEDIVRFLGRPEGRGLAVPGMPVNSPGMEQPGAPRDPYAVMAFDSTGHTRVYARHG